MEISASLGASAHVASSSSQVTRMTREANEPMSGPDNDGDRDDQVAVRSAQSTPSVNAMGETVGQLIDISA
jgi:hypothetical protein